MPAPKAAPGRLLPPPDVGVSAGPQRHDAAVVGRSRSPRRGSGVSPHDKNRLSFPRSEHASTPRNVRAAANIPLFPLSAGALAEGMSVVTNRRAMPMVPAGKPS